MASVVFVPCNGLQVRRLALVKRHLPASLKIHSVSNAKFVKIGAEEALRAAGMPFVRLEKMDELACGKLLDETHAKLLLVGNDSDYISYLFIQAAKKRGIRSLMMQDGAICRIEPPKGVSLKDTGQLFAKYSPVYLAGRLFSKLTSKVLRQSMPNVNLTGTYCTDIAAWGEFSKRTFLSRGVPSSRIHLTGNPSFDELSGKKPGKERAAGAKKTLLFAASDMLGARLWTQQEMDFMLSSLADAAGQIGANLIIRPHPSEDLSVYSSIAGRTGVTVSKQGSLFDVIRKSDAVLTEVSTVAFEAILLGKPIGIVDFTGRDVSKIYPAAYINSGAAISIKEPAQAPEQLSRLLSDGRLLASLASGRRRFIADQAHRLDGKASKRVAGLIVKLTTDSD